MTSNPLPRPPADLLARIAELEARLAESEAARMAAAAAQLRTEAALHAAETRYQALFDGSMDAVILTDDRGICVDANQAAATLFKTQRVQLIGRHVGQLGADTAEEIGLSPDAGSHGELVFSRTDGARRVVRHSTARILPGLHQILLRDITPGEAGGTPSDVTRAAELEQVNAALRIEIAERAAAEDTLRESQRFLERVLAASPSRTHIFDYPSRTVVYTSALLEASLGYTSEELQRMGGPYPIVKLIHPDDMALIPEQVRQQMAMADDEVLEREFRLRHADGSWRWLVTYDVVFSRDETGRPTQVLGQVFDITARKQTEMALAEANHQLDMLNASLAHTGALLQTIIDSLDDGLALLDEEGRLLTLNRAAADLLEIDHATAPGLQWDTISCLGTSILAQARASGHPVSARAQITRDGAARVLDVYAIPIQTPNSGLQMVIHSVDVTERLQFQELTIQNERLAATGWLAAVVAHEVNSPLQAIQNLLFLTTSEDRLERDTYLSMIGDEIDRVGSLIRRLLELQRPGDADLRLVDANALVEKVLALTASTLARHHVLVTRSLAPEPTLVLGRADQLTQVLLNLLLNAVDAMDYGGEVVVRTCRRRAQPSDALPGPPPADVVSIEVRDTGQGIADDVLPRIFEQFFTTKPSGSGLGLAISRQIVEQHGGSITAGNAEPHGALFTVALPAAQAAPPTAALVEQIEP